MNAQAPKGKPQGEINVTPLVDIVLVLLIIFMVITPLMQKGFTGALPERSKEGGGQAIVLQVGADGALFLNRESVKPEDLGERLSAVFAARSSKTLFVDADDKAPYEIVVKALDVCRAPGRAEAIGFVLN
jgi:biopolymer transport protein ExbD